MSNSAKYINLVDKLKWLRWFNPEHYLKCKVVAINNFFREEGLDAAVIGISGGIDSAVAFALLNEAKKQEGSPIKHISAMVLPVNCIGTTKQKNASSDASDFLSPYLSDSVHQIYFNGRGMVESVINELAPKTAWAVGQLASIVRTPVLYYQAARLQDEGYRSIVVGTTNRDEGSYIGFFGKASDAMVDLQPIADIHKSEVFALARLLKLPSFIVDRVPCGDVWDGRSDTEMIGAPYDFLEIYLLAKDYDFVPDLVSACNEQELKYIDAIERIHSTNKHKYSVGSPARFIDIKKRAVDGGWTNKYD